MKERNMGPKHTMGASQTILQYGSRHKHRLHSSSMTCIYLPYAKVLSNDCMGHQQLYCSHQTWLYVYVCCKCTLTCLL